MKKVRAMMLFALLPFIAVSLTGCVDSSEDSSDYDSEQSSSYDDDDDDDSGSLFDDDDEDDDDYDSDYDNDDDDSDDDSGYSDKQLFKDFGDAYYDDDPEKHAEWNKYVDENY